MFKFSQRSFQNLGTSHAEIIEVFTDALKISPIDFGISCGHRSKTLQDKAFNEGRSKLKWPHSKHNTYPSDAVDFFPWINGNIPWEDDRLFGIIAGIVLGIAHSKGYEFRWGGAWGGTLNRKGQFNDLPHIERVRTNGT